MTSIDFVIVSFLSGVNDANGLSLGPTVHALASDASSILIIRPGRKKVIQKIPDGDKKLTSPAGRWHEACQPPGKTR
jgi:hypothetical protein